MTDLINCNYFFSINRSVNKLPSPLEDARIQYATWSPGSALEIVSVCRLLFTVGNNSDEF